MDSLEGILNISSPFLPVSDELMYGGTERVIANMDREIERAGYHSYIAAPGDSKVQGTLVPTHETSLWLDVNGKVTKTEVNAADIDDHYRKALDFVYDNPGRIQVIHDHPGPGDSIVKRFPDEIRELGIPVLVTTHHASPNNDEHEKAKDFMELGKIQRDLGSLVDFNAISQSQRRHFMPYLDIPSENVVYHGLPIEGYDMGSGKGGYLFSIGRITPSKGQHIAIDTAKRLGMELIIAGGVQENDREYFEREILPNIDDKQIHYVGSLNDEQKKPYFRDAAAYLMPIQWEEPFGLVVIEAMASGTPVVAYNRGSMPEIITSGHDGEVVSETGDYERDIRNYANAVRNALDIPRDNPRRSVEERFTAGKETSDYIGIYESLVNR